MTSRKPRPAEPNLAASIPRADRRARVYKLEDDGASAAAQTRRWRKEKIGATKARLLDLELRQAGKDRYFRKPLTPESAAILRSQLKVRLAALKDENQQAPVNKVLAPMTRRVAREDRRRARITVR